MFYEDIYLEISKHLDCNELIPLCLTCKYLYRNQNIWKGKLDKNWKTNSKKPLHKAIKLRDHFEKCILEIDKQEGNDISNLCPLGKGKYIYLSHDRFIYKWNSNNNTSKILFGLQGGERFIFSELGA